jgi:hypothetical protein
MSAASKRHEQLTGDCSRLALQRQEMRGRRGWNDGSTGPTVLKCRPNVDGVSDAMKSLSQVGRCHAVDTPVGEDAQPELNSLWHPQPVQFSQHWADVVRLPGWEDNPRCGVED